MAIVHNITTENFTIVSNDILRNKSLSWKAKGLLSWLLGNGETFEVTIEGILSLGDDGEIAVRSGLEELKRAGYLRIKASQSADGTFNGHEWEVSNSPILGNSTETYVSRASGKPNFGKSRTNNTKDNNTKDNNKDILSANKPSAGFLPPKTRDELLARHTKQEHIDFCGRNFAAIKSIWLAYPDGKRRKLSELMLGLCAAIEADPSVANDLPAMLSGLKSMSTNDRIFLPAIGAWAEGMGWRAKRDVPKLLTFKEQQAQIERENRARNEDAYQRAKQRDAEWKAKLDAAGFGPGYKPLQEQL